MLIERKNFLVFFFLSSFLINFGICQSNEDSTDDPSSEDCCSDGESWMSYNCDPPPDPDRSPECLSSGKACCIQEQEIQASCQRGIAIGKVSQNCDDIEDEKESSCCSECRIGISLSIGSSDSCGNPDPQKPYYVCCMFAQTNQETTSELTTSEAIDSATEETEMSTMNTNEPSLNACELEGDDICAHKCVVTGRSYKCQCKSGYKLWTDNHSCRKMGVNRCLKNNPCDHKCTDTGDAIVCSCRRGYELMDDNQSCIDIDECSLQTNNCKDSQKCINTVGSYTCKAPERQADKIKPKTNCPSGFVFNTLKQVCDDDDECLKNPCPSGLSCVNTIGSFNCGFSPGAPVPPPQVALQPSPSLSPRIPEDIDSSMICPPGFRLNEETGECKDIDECAELSDDCNRKSQNCLNTHGRFTCYDKASKITCPAGFKRNSKFECEDINECSENPDICTPDSVCVNEPGSYECKPKSSIRQQPVTKATPVRSQQPTPQPIQPPRPSPSQVTIPRRPNFPRSCSRGYRKTENGGCADIDECAENTHSCDDYQDCENIMGGHRCKCKKGFQRDPITQACEDINECQRDELNNCTETQRCDNVPGSYHCIRYISCGTGYTLNALSSLCEDDNECLLGKHDCNKLGPMYTCYNMPGTYRCIRRTSPTPITTTTTIYPDFEYSEEYYPEVETSNPKVDNSQKYPQPSEKNDVPTFRPTPIPAPDYKQNRPTEPPARERPDYKRTDEESRRPYEDPRRPYEVPTRPHEDPRRQYEVPTRPYEDPKRQYEDPRQPFEEPERPTQTSVYRKPYVEPVRPDEYPRRDPEKSYPEEPKESNSIDDSITTTPPPATKVFIYGSDQQTEQNTYKTEYPVDTNESNGSTDDNENIPRPSVYYPKSYNQRPAVDEPKYATIPEPRERPITLVGDPDVEGNIVVNTNEVKENTWTQLVPGLKKCPPGHVMDSKKDCIDIDECKTGRNLCDPNSEVCFNTPGDYRCICAPGFIKERGSGRCQKKDDLYPIPIAGFQPVWVPTPRKVCDIGFQLDSSNNECLDIDECSDGTARCATNEQCINTVGGFRCQCSPGYTLVSGRCIQPPQPFSPSRGRQPTSVIRVTTPTRQNFCLSGFKFENNRCVDVDECATDKHTCLQNQHCVNVPGGYLCHCAPGHRLVQDGGCRDVDECHESGGKVCSQYATCINTIGSFECKCRPGFATSPMSKQLCNDVDECQENGGLGPCQQKCVNIWGSFRCACKPGYKLNPDNRTCIDIDECSEPIRKLCVGTCQNVPGSYQCTCPSGYKMGADKRSCIDIDECESGELVCGADEACQNTRGGARCSSIACPSGYSRDATSRHRCRRPTGMCSIHDYNCLHRPETYSFNFITFVSKLYIPTGPRPQVDLFTMKGPNWPESMLHFQLRLVDVRAPRDINAADMSCFKLTPSPQQALVSLVKPLIGPQDILLELSMDLYRLGNFEGTAVAKIIIFVSEYEF